MGLSTFVIRRSQGNDGLYRFSLVFKWVELVTLPLTFVEYIGLYIIKKCIEHCHYLQRNDDTIVLMLHNLRLRDDEA